MNQHRLPSDVIGLAKVMPPLSRRGFMSTTAAAAAGYTLAAGPVRADAIHTDIDGLDAGDSKIKVSGGQMPIYYARPAGVAHPPIILLCMEIFGLHEWVKDVTRRLGHLGAFAVAPDYYFRDGVDLTKMDDIQKICRSSTPRPIRSSFPTSTPRQPGRSRKAATATGSASWAFAAAAAAFGITPRTIRI